MTSPFEQLAAEIRAGGRVLDRLADSFPSISIDIITDLLNRALVGDSIASGVRNVDLLHQFHPDTDPVIIQEILLESLITRGEENIDLLHSLCLDISRHNIQHRVTSHKVAMTKAFVHARSPLVRNLMPDPPSGPLNRAPEPGWQSNGFGGRSSKPHRP